MVFKSVTEDHKIHAAISKDDVVEVNKAFADDILNLNDYLEERNIEMELINEAPVVVSVLVKGLPSLSQLYFENPRICLHLNTRL